MELVSLEEQIQFSKGSILLTLQEAEQVHALLSQETNSPNKLDGIILDGSDYTLTIYGHETQVTHLFRWESQLEGSTRDWYMFLIRLIHPEYTA